MANKQELINKTQEKFGQFSNLLFPKLETLTNKQLEKLLSADLLISENFNAFPFYSKVNLKCLELSDFNYSLLSQIAEEMGLFYLDVLGSPKFNLIWDQLGCESLYGGDLEKMLSYLQSQLKSNKKKQKMQKTKLINKQWLNNPSHCTFDFQTSTLNKDGEEVSSKPIQVLTKLELDKEKGNLVFPFSIMTKKGQEKIGSVTITREFLLNFNLIPTPIFKKTEWLTDYPEISNYEQLVSHILINCLENHTYLHKSHIQDYRVILLSEFLKYLDENQELFSFEGYEQKQESLDDMAKLTIIENAYNHCTAILGESIENTMLDVLHNAYCLESETKQ